MLGLCPSPEWKDRCLPVKTLQHVCILQSIVGLEPKIWNLSCLLHTMFLPQSSHFWSACQNSPWHAFENPYKEVNKPKTFEAKVFFFHSLSRCLWIFSSNALRQTKLFSLTITYLYLFSPSPTNVKRDIQGLWEDTGAITVAIQVGQLFEAWPPVAEIVIVLIRVCT